MQCYTEYIQVCAQYQSVYTATYWYRLYISLYPSMKPVYLGVYAYEQVQDGIYAHERSISAYKSVYTRIYAYVTFCKNMRDSRIRTGNLIHTARLLWPLHHQRWYWWVIWFMSARLRFEVAHHLLADVGLESRPGRLRQIASECHVILVWVSLPVRLYLSPSHYAPSDSAKSLRSYTCYCKCAWTIKPDAKHIKMDWAGSTE